MKPRLVIIGASDFQNPLILKANSLGFETHVFAWKEGAVGKKYSDFFYPISIREKERILEKCRKINPAGVCSIASDLASITVNYVAENLGLPGNTVSGTEKRTNKYIMRKALATVGLDVPQFLRVNKKSLQSILEKLESFHYPLIVKPTDRSGSRGITKIEYPYQIMQAVNDAVKDSFEDYAIVEEYIEGEEYSCETISYHGVHKILAITKKFTTGVPHFIESGHLEPADIGSEMRAKIERTIFKALDALEITDSAGHSEFKICPDGKIRIIEVGGRMGGDCIGSDLVQISTGMDFMKMVIDVATDEEPDFSIVSEPTPVMIKFILDEYDLLELKKNQKEHANLIYRVSDLNLEKLGKTKDSDSRAGYYIFKLQDEDKK